MGDVAWSAMFRSLAVSVVLVLAVAACGGDDKAEPPVTTGAPVTSPVEPLGCAAMFADGAPAPAGDGVATCKRDDGTVTVVIPVRLGYDECDVFRNDYGWWTSTDPTVTAEPEPDAETLALACS